MIADELSQDDIDALLGGLGGDDDAGGDLADDALSALSGDGDAEIPGLDSFAESAPEPSGTAVALPEFSAEDAATPSQEIQSLLNNVNVNVKVRLGKTEMLVDDILKLKPGQVVQLDTMSGDPVDILVNNRVVAKGEVIILNEAFCVRISEIYSTRDKIDRQN